MEEEITYSTVVFQNGKTRPRDQPVNKEDMTVYSEVKTKGKVPASADTKEEPAARSWPLLAGLGILSVLLVASIVVLAYIMVRMREQRSNLTDLRAENEEMEKRNGILMNETEQLSGERARLNWTLGVILTFNNFPVKAFCPEKIKGRSQAKSHDPCLMVSLRHLQRGLENGKTPWTPGFAYVTLLVIRHHTLIGQGPQAAGMGINFLYTAIKGETPLSPVSSLFSASSFSPTGLCNTREPAKGRLSPS
ncbi:uncharacterized protein LOC133441140 isoform X3 [Cololabis saira]|uniref:uncharacterized protein LOC133441140 isoform X3 n=1 Tax=Cololabis saira TaxID=129043 RepID=UPI002AD3D395|nr:uncharacterized protein LOC133441140 isoform X3 [Cololabis saira]